jgi:hypothetical protein
MTIKELYDAAKILGIENYNIEVQYRDDGGFYSGTEELEKIESIVYETNTIII